MRQKIITLRPRPCEISILCLIFLQPSQLPQFSAQPWPPAPEAAHCCAPPGRRLCAPAPSRPLPLLPAPRPSRLPPQPRLAASAASAALAAPAAQAAALSLPRPSRPSRLSRLSRPSRPSRRPSRPSRPKRPSRPSRPAPAAPAASAALAAFRPPERPLACSLYSFSWSAIVWEFHSNIGNTDSAKSAYIPHKCSLKSAYGYGRADTPQHILHTVRLEHAQQIDWFLVRPLGTQDWRSFL